MKNKSLYLITSLFLCSSCSIANFFTPKAKILKSPSAFRSVVKGENFDKLSENVREFAANFTSISEEKLDDENENYAVSPLSMFSALAVASACASGNTKQELLDALKTEDSLLSSEFANLYSACNYLRTYDSDKHVVKREELTNSLWLDKNVSFKPDCLDFLADKFYAYTAQVDYLHDAKKASRQMSKFVEEKTYGLLKPEFNFSFDTVLTILNTLYFKSLWNANSDNIAVSPDKTNFENRDGSITSKNLFVTEYETGRIIRNDKYSSFFAQTAANDRIKFVVPNDGVKLEEVINYETILEINNAEYKGFDEENNTMYYGKTYFPGFEAKCNIDAKEYIKALGVKDFFISGACDFAPLTDDSVYCDAILHETKLEVAKKGIEGAAYTAVVMKGESAPMLPEYKEVFEEFVVDKAFYYVVCDHNNLPLFSGVVNKI